MTVIYQVLHVLNVLKNISKMLPGNQLLMQRYTATKCHSGIQFAISA